jgi:hypothetical protein
MVGGECSLRGKDMNLGVILADGRRTVLIPNEGSVLLKSRLNIKYDDMR